MKKVLLGAFLVTLIAATPARAQDDKLVHVNIGGGFTVPVSTFADHFGTGGGFNIGVSIDPKPTVGFQVEYSYNQLSGQSKTIDVSPAPGGSTTPQLLESHSTMHYIDFNGTFRPGGDSKVKPYGIGGLGAYYRTVSLTTPAVGYTTICDPWWYVCYPALVPVDQVIGDRSSWDMGINIGGGIQFALGESAQFYVETRWHYIWGPTFKDLQGVDQKANAQFLPVTFGFRF
jgi:opacity protein-like surface antigen